MRSGLVASVWAAVAVLIAWAFFAGDASGTGATAPLGTAAVIVAALVVIGWSRGAVPLPRLDRAGLTAVAATVGLVAWSGLTVWWSIAGDRSWDALAKGIVLLAVGVVGLAAGLQPGRPLRTLALLLAGLTRGRSLVGAARQGASRTRAGRCEPGCASEGIDRLLERARARGRRGARARPLAARRGARALRATGRRAPRLPRRARDPADAVPRRIAGRRRRRGGHPVALRGTSRGGAPRPSLRRPRDRRRRLGVHPARPRRRRRRARGSCRRRAPAGRDARRRRHRGRCPRRPRPGRPARLDPAAGRRPWARRRSRARPGGRHRRARRQRREPVHVGGRPAKQQRRGRERLHPPRQSRDEQSHRLVGRGLAGVPCPSRRRHGREHVRDRAQARPRQRPERDRATQPAAPAPLRLGAAGPRSRGRARDRARSRDSREREEARPGRERRRRWG